jgi:uncharacterized membrane protein
MTEVGARRVSRPVALLDRGSESHQSVAATTPELSRPRTRILPTRLARAKQVGWALIGLQLVAMVALSTVQYSRYALTTDFGAYSQALWKIAHGNLDPTSTVLSAVFWKNDAEFLMWPLALLFHVYPHPVLLLWLQDLVIAATEIVTLGWVIDVVGRSGFELPERRRALLVVAVAVAMVLNPWVYETIGFDFHFETVATLFVVLVGRDLWSGRTRRLWWWVALALLSSVLGGLYLFGVGISGVLSGRRTRRTGLMIGAIGLGAFLVLSAMGAAGLGGRLIDSGYAYLAPGHHGHLGVMNIGIGALRHPGAVVHMAARRWPAVFEFIVVVGLIGVISPWGCGMALVVFVPSVLNSNPAFLRLDQSFQSWPALPFVLVGSVMVLVRLHASQGIARRVAVATTVVWVVSVAVIAAAALPQAGHWIAVDSPAAAQLASSQAKIPPDAEVIASQGVVGRFADRDDVYPFPFQYHPVGTSQTTFPVKSSLVVFVLTPTQGIGEAPAADTRNAIGYVERRLGARVIDARADVYVLAWSPPPHTTTVTLPLAP